MKLNIYSLLLSFLLFLNMKTATETRNGIDICIILKHIPKKQLSDNTHQHSSFMSALKVIFSLFIFFKLLVMYLFASAVVG